MEETQLKTTDQSVPQTETTSTKAQSSSSSSTSKTKVMIVEDDPMILEMYVRKFEQEGYAVTSQDHGDGVVELAVAEQPKVILLDVIMPGLDGFSALQTLKEHQHTKSIPVMMLTNLGQEEDKEKGEQMGAVGYIVKSSKTPGEVVKVVREFLTKH